MLDRALVGEDGVPDLVQVLPLLGSSRSRWRFFTAKEPDRVLWV